VRGTSCLAGMCHSIWWHYCTRSGWQL
jgi:hypothetical protein